MILYACVLLVIIMVQCVGILVMKMVPEVPENMSMTQ